MIHVHHHTSTCNRLKSKCKTLRFCPLKIQKIVIKGKREKEKLSDVKSKLPHKNSHFIPLCDNNFSKKGHLAVMGLNIGQTSAVS